MKRVFLSMTILIVLLCSCGQKQPSTEKMISPSNVEITGPDADKIAIAGDIKIYAYQNTDDDNKWSIRAVVPVQSLGEQQNIDDIQYFYLDLFDENYSQVDNKYGMNIQNEDLGINFFNSPVGTTKNLAFEPIWKNTSYQDFDRVIDYINRTENIVIKLQLSEATLVKNETEPDKVYSCGFDGFVNMRSESSYSSSIVGKLMNGPEGALLLEDLGEWKKIDNNGLVGYVPAKYVQDEPTVAFNGDITANWIEGAWKNNNGATLLVFSNGTWSHSNASGNSHGLYIMQNNEVRFMPVSTGFDETLEILKNVNKLGDYQKVTISNDQLRSARLDYDKVYNELHSGIVLYDSTPSVEYQAETTRPSGSNDWNSVLDSYEKVVDKYIKAMKKAANGDISTLSESMSLMEEYESLAAKIDKAQGEMTSAQVNRYLKITQKMTQAAYGL